MPDLTLIATVTIFIATYAVVAVGKVPVYRIDRRAALLGGSLIIAMAATFAGNFTLVGSVANLIVAQRAKARGVEIGFWAISRSAHH